jgi:hypothetical protein
MRKYHHLGMPSDRKRDGEYYIEEFKVHVVPFDSNPYGIEWMRYERGSPVPEIVRKVPHLAFEVDELEKEIAGQQVLIPPNSPSPGVTVAFIIHDGLPIEFLQYEQPSPEKKGGPS